MSEKYICSICKNEYEKKWSDEEAIEEMNDNFGDIPTSDCGIVCDDCYKKMMYDKGLLKSHVKQCVENLFEKKKFSSEAKEVLLPLCKKVQDNIKKNEDNTKNSKEFSNKFLYYIKKELKLKSDIILEEIYEKKDVIEMTSDLFTDLVDQIMEEQLRKKMI